MREDREQLTTFEEHFSGAPHDVVALSAPSISGDRTLPNGHVVDAPVAVAEVQHGRWIARCPLCPGGAEFVNTETLLFFCCNCRNAAVDNAYLSVELPDEKTRGEIAKVLCEDVDLEVMRNWVPGETVVDLQLQAVAAKTRLEDQAVLDAAAEAAATDPPADS